MRKQISLSSELTNTNQAPVWRELVGFTAFEGYGVGALNSEGGPRYFFILFIVHFTCDWGLTFKLSQ